MKAVCDNNQFSYHQFDFKKYEKKLLHYFNKKDIDGISCDGYFIISSTFLKKDELFIVENQKCYRVKKSHCVFASCKLLGRHELVMGSCREKNALVCSKKEYLNDLIEFKNIIIDIELYWVSEFLKIIHSHLKTRRSNKSNLITHDAIQIMLGDVVIHIKFAEQYRNYTNEFSRDYVHDYQLSAVKELKCATQFLARLHGGRSFLSGNVIEMMMIFEYFRNIYFC